MVIWPLEQVKKTAIYTRPYPFKFFHARIIYYFFEFKRVRSPFCQTFFISIFRICHFFFDDNLDFSQNHAYVY
ncbi:hypothetical protein GQ61_06155 [Candidatus Nucleicultrix amoebiphila FS5]|uniref:Uncharacterized protein n=1 Tax=Candidatus Nucleicultrix amoebiphila FS5 TaxID=1414854 RepID=A0A1W6N4Z4_9PROT|nr:hypothetical protein GQ61_06155 [Candidatus Nucleicultrix amoebiphila FS5]